MLHCLQHQHPPLSETYKLAADMPVGKAGMCKVSAVATGHMI